MFAIVSRTVILVGVHILLSLSMWRTALSKSQTARGWKKMNALWKGTERRIEKQAVGDLHLCFSRTCASHLNAGGASQERECETAAGSSFVVNVHGNVKHILLRCGDGEPHSLMRGKVQLLRAISTGTQRRVCVPYWQTHSILVGAYVHHALNDGNNS